MGNKIIEVRNTGIDKGTAINKILAAKNMISFLVLAMIKPTRICLNPL